MFTQRPSEYLHKKDKRLNLLDCKTKLQWELRIVRPFSVKSLEPDENLLLQTSKV